MNFRDALQAMKEGKHVTRESRRHQVMRLTPANLSRLECANEDGAFYAVNWLWNHNFFAEDWVVVGSSL